MENKNKRKNDDQIDTNGESKERAKKAHTEKKTYLRPTKRKHNSLNKCFLCISLKHKSKDVIIYMRSVISSDTANPIPRLMQYNKFIFVIDITKHTHTTQKKTKFIEVIFVPSH